MKRIAWRLLMIAGMLILAGCGGSGGLPVGGERPLHLQVAGWCDDDQMPGVAVGRPLGELGPCARECEGGLAGPGRGDRQEVG